MRATARGREPNTDDTALLVAGTASHVGNSTVVAGLCRRLSRGISVAPYKAQNMSDDARAVVTLKHRWGETGVSQYVQARAANVAPTTDMHPVLLQPRGDDESQLVVHGEAVGHYERERTTTNTGLWGRGRGERRILPYVEAAELVHHINPPWILSDR